jgi:hypothetical protein
MAMLASLIDGYKLRLAAMMAGCLLSAGTLVVAQNPAVSGQAASLNDSLLARASVLYDSTAKSGMHGFDCEVHPDWNTLLASARKVSSIPQDDPKLMLLSGVRITVHVRMNGGSSMDWRMADGAAKPADAAMLERTHKGIEQTLLGVIKLWIPLVDGSVAESLGEEDVSITESADGYTLRSKDKGNTLTEAFDKGLLLKHFIARDTGSTVDIEPVFANTPRGLLLSGFNAHVRPDKAQEAAEMRVGIAYPASAGYQIPSKIDAELVGEAKFSFALDGCSANP